MILELTPDTGEDMLVACLCSKWVGADGEVLCSFSAIPTHCYPSRRNGEE